ncbi:hypothetical protein NJB18091_50290 [Mycobacterium marinum]|uniref:Uncharacterized protein n=1 Tax=Mycobacterium pseudoshottsii TaxID=265949 RepID=A0A9N7LWS8_9MYCO|nr:hypothetical protein MPSD_36030 [Mycobacterium pseudoshottsii JCM 15466]BDN83324.1 hypothetical protein NJB1907Z4_C35390 [Mycobacterium pseudoshottsii]GJO08131.1 hypothetical protein NJB18091_50290 [Mycobacterium marinum]GJO30424.1 hypothetical protein NJB1507_38780 [Mycobacterium marinum]
MDLSVREVGQPADVVEVEVGQHDMANVGRPVAKALDLVHRSFVLQQGRPKEVTKRAQPARIKTVLYPKAGVDQDQPVAGLDEQDVAQQCCAG